MKAKLILKAGSALRNTLRIIFLQEVQDLFSMPHLCLLAAGTFLLWKLALCFPSSPDSTGRHHVRWSWLRESGYTDRTDGGL